MAPSGRTPDEQVKAFKIDETYLFKHYFEGEDVFDRLIVIIVVFSRRLPTPMRAIAGKSLQQSL